MTQKSKTLTLYGHDRCPGCKSTASYLDKHDIPFEKLDVTKDPTAMDAIREMGYQSVPVVVTPSGEHWGGFRPDKLMKVATQAAA